MSDQAKPDLKPFFKGTLPSWFSALMLTLLVYFGKRVMDEFDSVRHDQLQTRERVQALEINQKTVEASIIELRLGQKDVVSELRAINAVLQKR